LLTFICLPVARGESRAGDRESNRKIKEGVSETGAGVHTGGGVRRAVESQHSLVDLRHLTVTVFSRFFRSGGGFRISADLLNDGCKHTKYHGPDGEKSLKETKKNNAVLLVREIDKSATSVHVKAVEKMPAAKDFLRGVF